MRKKTGTRRRVKPIIIIINFDSSVVLIREMTLNDYLNTSNSNSNGLETEWGDVG